jgi:hypothetical protein
VLLDTLQGAPAMALHASRLPRGGWRLLDARGALELLSMDVGRGGRLALPTELPPAAPRAEEDAAEAWLEYDVYARGEDGYDSAGSAGSPASLRVPGDGEDAYSGCYDSPAHFPEADGADGSAAAAAPGEDEISPGALQGMLNTMLLYDSYGSDDLDALDVAQGG